MSIQAYTLSQLSCFMGGPEVLMQIYHMVQMKTTRQSMAAHCDWTRPVDRKLQPHALELPVPKNPSLSGLLALV